MHTSNSNAPFRELARFETCKWSVLHWLFATPPDQPVTFWKCRFLPYVATVFLFFLFPLIVAFFSLPALMHPTIGVNVPYLRDLNVLFMFLVTLPVLVTLLLSERSLLPSRIAEVERAKVLVIDKDKIAPLIEFFDRWRFKYGCVNIISQVAGILIGITIAWANYNALTSGHSPTWQITNGQINPAGWGYLAFQIPVFYFVVSVYLARGVATIIFLNNLVQAPPVSVVVDPFAPDKAGGLRPIGQIGLRNQYVLATGGINLVFMIIVARSLGVSQEMTRLVIAATLLYVVGGPLMFIGPLLPFRRSMLKKKKKEMKAIGERLRREYDRTIDTLDKEEMPKGQLQSIKELEELRAFVAKTPVWPFDTSTCRKFLAAYILPILAVILTSTSVLKQLLAYVHAILK